MEHSIPVANSQGNGQKLEDRINNQIQGVKGINMAQAATHLLVNQSQEFGVRSRQQLLPDKFKYFHYLLAGQCVILWGELVNHFQELKE